MLRKCFGIIVYTIVMDWTINIGNKTSANYLWKFVNHRQTNSGGSLNDNIKTHPNTWCPLGGYILDECIDISHVL